MPGDPAPDPLREGLAVRDDPMHGTLPALVFHEIDPMSYISVLGFVVPVASTWTMRAVNLYSTSLVTSTALRRVR